MIDQYFPLGLTSAASTATAWVMVVPYRCVLRDVLGGASAAITRTFTFTYGGNTLGVFTFTAAQTGSWAANASHGNDVIASEGSMTITQSSTATAAEVILSVEFDPYASTKADFS